MFVHCCWECNLVESQCKRVWRVLKKLKIELPHNTAIPLLSIYVNKLKTLIWKDIHTPMFIGALFTTKKWNQPKCLVTDEYIKTWGKDNLICICIYTCVCRHIYIYIMEYYLNIKKEWNLDICSNMDGTRRCHPSRERQILHDVIYMWNLKDNTNKCIQQTDRVIYI